MNKNWHLPDHLFLRVSVPTRRLLSNSSISNMRVSLSIMVIALSIPCVLSSSLAAINASLPTSVDETRFATSTEIKHLVNMICGGGLRLPGSTHHIEVVNFIKCQLDGIPGLTMDETKFEIDG